MSQNLLIPQATPIKRSRCLLHHTLVGLQLVRHHCFPWVVLAIAPLKLLFTSGVERIHEQVRYFNAIMRIDFVGVYGFVNSLLW